MKEETKIARKMFEELGYELFEDNESDMLVYYDKETRGIAIDFYLKEKAYAISINDNEFYPINLALNKAIQKQIQELGWEGDIE